MSGIIVIGVGNILFTDEGVGVYAAKYLEENFDFHPSIEIIDGGVLGFKLLHYYQSYERVIILDTVTIDDQPGSLYHLPSDELMGLGSYRQSAHEVEVVEMLEIASLMQSLAEVSVVGIIPDDIKRVDIDLTDVLKRSFPSYIQAVLKVLHNGGIETTPKTAHRTLEHIIAAYANPTMSER